MKDYYEVKKVSNSSLSWFQTSPKYFKGMLDGEITEPSKSYFERGEQIHQYLLEPDEFEKNYLFLDYTTPRSQQQKDFCEKVAYKRKGKKEEILISAYKDIYSTKESDDKILEKAQALEKQYKDYIKYIKLSHSYVAILPENQRIKFQTIANNVLEHELASTLIFNEDHKFFGNTKDLFISNEFPIYWTSANGIECKSLLDRLIIDFKNKRVTLVDLKTTSHLSEFADKFMEYKYYRQMAFYWMALYWYFKHEYPDIDLNEFEKETYIVAISTSDLAEIKVFKISESKLNIGFDEITPLLDDIKWHYDNGKWDYTRKYYEGILFELL